MIRRVASEPSVAAAFIFCARCWLALASLTGAARAKRPGKYPKKSNSARMRWKCPLAIDEPAYDPADVPTIMSASDGASMRCSNSPWKKPQYQAR